MENNSIRELEEFSWDNLQLCFSMISNNFFINVSVLCAWQQYKRAPQIMALYCEKSCLFLFFKKFIIFFTIEKR